MCPTLCDPIDGSPPDSSVFGILQARTPEWVAISFSNAWKWKIKVKSLSRVWLLATPWTVAYQAPPSMGFPRQEYWSGVPLPSPIYTAILSKSIFLFLLDFNIETYFQLLLVAILSVKKESTNTHTHTKKTHNRLWKQIKEQNQKLIHSTKGSHYIFFNILLSEINYGFIVKASCFLNFCNMLSGTDSPL